MEGGGKLRNVSGKTDYFLKMAAIFRLVGSWDGSWTPWSVSPARWFINFKALSWLGAWYWIRKVDWERRWMNTNWFPPPYLVGYFADSSALLRRFFFVGIYSYFCLQLPQSGKFTWLPNYFFIKDAHPNYEQVILAPPRWSPPSGVFFSAVRHWFCLFGNYILKLEIYDWPWPLSAKNGKKVSYKSLIRLRLREAPLLFAIWDPQ